MGKGNVCVSGPYEGLFYIDNDYTTVLRREDDCEDTILQKDLSAKDLSGNDWLFDDEGSANELGGCAGVLCGELHAQVSQLCACQAGQVAWPQCARHPRKQPVYIGIEDSDWPMPWNCFRRITPVRRVSRGSTTRRTLTA